MMERGEAPPRGVRSVRGKWEAPCLDVSHLSEEDLVAFAIADNRTHDRGADDPAKLAALLDDLEADLSLAAGYTDSDVHELLEQLRGPNPKEPAEPVTVDPTTETFEHVCPRCKFEFNS